jgi:hypothetical protein
VLKDNTGTAYSKNRLACSMLKSVGIPARLIARNTGKIWGEAFIQGKGWVPFDVTMPYYTIGDDIESRLCLPLPIQEKNMAVSWISGASDDLKTLFWRPETDASITTGEDLYKQLTAIDSMKTVKMLVVLPAEFELIPIESKIPVSKTL